MFSHRGLFLAVTISLASIALAGVLIQPGYQHQYDSNPRYSQDQSAPQYWTQSPKSEEASTTENEDPKEARRERMEEYERKMDFIRHTDGGHFLQPLMVHNRRKRSDPASSGSSKSEVVARDNDMAATSLSTDAKHPTTIDSLLPEHEPTDTTDKRVENRQIRNDYVTNPRSFSFYVEDTQPDIHTYFIPNTWQSMINQHYTNRHSEPINSAQDDDLRIIYNRPLQSSSSQKSDDNVYSSKYRDNGSDSASDSTSGSVVQYISPPRQGHIYGIPQRKTRYYMEETCGRAAHHEPEKKSLHEITDMNLISTAEPSQDKTLQIPLYSEMTPKAHQYADTAATSTSIQSQTPFVNYMQTPYRSNEELSAINEIVRAPYDTNDRPYPNYNFNHLYNYPRYWNNDWSNAEGLEDFFIQLKKKNDKTSTNAPNREDRRIVPIMIFTPYSDIPKSEWERRLGIRKENVDTRINVKDDDHKYMRPYETFT